MYPSLSAEAVGKSAKRIGVAQKAVSTFSGPEKVVRAIFISCRG